MQVENIKNISDEWEILWNHCEMIFYGSVIMRSYDPHVESTISIVIESKSAYNIYRIFTHDLVCACALADKKSFKSLLTDLIHSSIYGVADLDPNRNHSALRLIESDFCIWNVEQAEFLITRIRVLILICLLKLWLMIFIWIFIRFLWHSIFSDRSKIS